VAKRRDKGRKEERTKEARGGRRDEEVITRETLIVSLYLTLSDIKANSIRAVMAFMRGPATPSSVSIHLLR
jgi:hypothetical protein